MLEVGSDLVEMTMPKTESTAALIDANLPPKLQTGRSLKEKLLAYHGFFFAILSALFIALSNVLVKKATLLSGSEQAAVRYLLQLLFMIPIVIISKNNFLGPKESRMPLLKRGILGTLTLVAMHYTLKLINPSDAVAIFSLKTMLVSIIARVILKEKMNLSVILSLALSIIGILLIAQPSFLFPKENLLNTTLFSSNTSQQMSNEAFKTALGVSFGKFSTQPYICIYID